MNCACYLVAACEAPSAYWQVPHATPTWLQKQQRSGRARAPALRPMERWRIRQEKAEAAAAAEAVAAAAAAGGRTSGEATPCPANSAPPSTATSCTTSVTSSPENPEPLQSSQSPQPQPQQQQRASSPQSQHQPPSQQQQQQQTPSLQSQHSHQQQQGASTSAQQSQQLEAQAQVMRVPRRVAVPSAFAAPEEQQRRSSGARQGTISKGSVDLASLLGMLGVYDGDSGPVAVTEGGGGDGAGMDGPRSLSPGRNGRPNLVRGLPGAHLTSCGATASLNRQIALGTKRTSVHCMPL